MFISVPHNGRIYIAERNLRGWTNAGKKFLWSVMPDLPIAPDVRIDARQVPRLIRRQAYRRLSLNLR